MPGEICEGHIDFAFCSAVQHNKFKTERACGGLHLAGLSQGERIFRVDQRCKRAAPGHKLMGDLYPLRTHFRSYDCHPGDVAARSVELTDKSGLNCIAAKGANNRYC